MFRHKKKSSAKKEKEVEVKDNKEKEVKEDLKQKTENGPAEEEKVEKEDGKKKKVTTSDDGMKELLEKNLKWSQIIYEQNRKLNRKLTWAAIAGWLRLLLILAPLVLAFLYLPPILKDVWGKFNNVTGLIDSNKDATTSGKNSTLDEIIKIFNLSPDQKAQVQGALKK